MPRDPIAELVHLYADAVVHHDEEQWVATWADDATWQFSPGRVIEGREAIREFWLGAMGSLEAAIQTVLNGTYTLDEEAGTGSGRWYIQEHYLRTDGDKGQLLAHYDDTYVRAAATATPGSEGAWLFARRVLVVHYGGPADLSAPFLNAWGSGSASESAPGGLV